MGRFTSLYLFLCIDRFMIRYVNLFNYDKHSELYSFQDITPGHFSFALWSRIVWSFWWASQIDRMDIVSTTDHNHVCKHAIQFANIIVIRNLKICKNVHFSIAVSVRPLLCKVNTYYVRQSAQCISLSSRVGDLITDASHLEISSMIDSLNMKD